MTKESPSKFGPEVLLIFVGHSDDANGEAEAVLGVEGDLQRVLERHLEVANGSLPFKTVRLWEWNRDAPPNVGGQERVVTPVVDRANVAVFLFKERVGRVTWEELDRCRGRSAPAIPVLAFFPDAAPDAARAKDRAVVAAWLDLLDRKEALTADWTAPTSSSLTPMADYKDVGHLRGLILERLSGAIAGLLRPPPVTAALPPAPPGRFLADHDHLNYDRRPVLTHSLEELDQALLRAFLDRPLSQDSLPRVRTPGAARPSAAEHLLLLGCLSDGRPTLGAFLCFAPPPLLADKFDGCGLQLVAYSGTSRASSRPSITPARGNLLWLFEEGMRWLTTQSGLRRQGRVGAAARDELEIPEIVLREVLANALVHRDYETPALRDQPTRVEVYSDRVEITSFGGLPRAVSVEALNSDAERVVPFRRNPVIARVFQHMSHVELNASGVPRMRREMEKVSLPPPRFIHDLHESVVRVVLLRPSEWAEAPEPFTANAGPTPGGPLRVFISSTARDLPEHRSSVRDACLRMGYFPLLMEHLPASDADAVAASLRLVDEADIYIGLFAHRYGYVPQGHTVSMSEMEYDRAAARGIPRLLFLIHDDHPVRATDVETGAGVEKLRALKERLRKELVAGFFKTPEDLRGQVLSSLSELHRRLQKAQPGDVRPARPAGGTVLPTPPEPFAHPPYIPSAPGFVGREGELNLLTDWGANPQSELYSAQILCLVGLGGMGKSSLAWKWFTDVAPQRMKPLAGRVWWSFYERGTSMTAFLRHALAYLTRQTPDALRNLSTQDCGRQLLAELRQRPYLLVLDGFERVLTAYHRLDGARVWDDRVSEDIRECTDPADGDVLRQLVHCGPSKVLVSTRLMPRELEDRHTHRPVPGIRHLELDGLTPADALALVRNAGIRGGDEAVLRFADHFGRHALLLRIVCGMVADYRPRPGDFDAWLADPHAGGGLRLSDLPLVQRRTHILEHALRGLGERGLSVLAAIAASRAPATYEALSASLVGTGKPLPGAADLDAALGDLEDRGLVVWNRDDNRYDMHPVVRAAALN